MLSYFLLIFIMLKSLLFWLVLGSVASSLYSQFQSKEEKTDITYSQFIQSVKQGDVSNVTIAGSRITGTGVGGEQFSTYSPGDLGLMGDLLNNGVDVIAKPPEKEGFFKQLIISLAPILLLIGVILYTMKGAGGAMGGKNPMSFGKSKARLIPKDETNVTFKDVAGVEEAKEDVKELVDFLSEPGKFTKVGGKIPKGSKALTEIASNLPTDILFIVSTGKLDFAQQKAKWFKTLDANGTIVQVWEVQRDHLIGWVANHMQAEGLNANSKIVEAIAYFTEGNLLASMQEIQKLKIAYPDGNINADEYLKQLNQQSHYTIYNLVDSALSGNSEQMLKIYATMTDDTAMPIILSSTLYREISAIITMSIELQRVKQVESVMESHRVWKSRKSIIGNTLKRLPYQHLQKMLLLLGRIDRSIKGMDNLNVINELRTLLLTLSGKTPWTQ